MLAPEKMRKDVGYVLPSVQTNASKVSDEVVPGPQFQQKFLRHSHTKSVLLYWREINYISESYANYLAKSLSETVVLVQHMKERKPLCILMSECTNLS